jgi:tyrosine aminotransferase
MRTIPGLRMVMPQGAMYAMIGIDIERFEGIENDSEFSQKLLDEEHVFVLPGQCFKMPNFVRIGARCCMYMFVTGICE